MTFLTEKLPSPIEPSPTHQIIDASKLKKFLECPRSFFYEYLLGWRPERPNNHLVFGTAWHEAMEWLLLNGYDEDSLFDAYQAFLVSYRKELPETTDELFWPKTPERAFQAIAAYAGTYQNDLELYEPLYTEIGGSVPVGQSPDGSERRMTFRMDSILRNRKTEEVFSLEHKTGSANNRQWAEQWELDMSSSLYTHVMYCHFEPETVKGVVLNGTFFLKNKGTRGGKLFDFARIPAWRTKSQMQAWFVNVDQWLNFLEREYRKLAISSDSEDVLRAFPLNTTACTKWFGCLYKDFCMAWKNPLQKCALPPLGFKVDHWNPLAEEPKTKWEN